MKEEVIDVVDEKDNVIDTKPKSEIRKKVLTHRGVAVFLLNSKNEILIHQRASTKKIHPLCWSLFFGGFVSSGEDYRKAAFRELEEETSIKTDKLDFITIFRYKTKNDDWFGKLYKCVSDQKPKFQEEEVKEGFFIPIKQSGEFIKKKKIKNSDLFIYKNFKRLIK